MFVQDEWRPTRHADAAARSCVIRSSSGTGISDRESSTSGPRGDVVGSGRQRPHEHHRRVRTVFRQPVQRADQRRQDRRRRAAFESWLSRAGPPFRRGDRRDTACRESVLASAPSLSLAVSPAFDAPYTHQYSVTVNRQLASDLVGERVRHRNEGKPLRELDRLQPAPAVARPGTPAGRRQRRRRHVGVGASVHAVGRELVSRAARVGDQAALAWIPGDGFVHACRRPRTASATSSAIRRRIRDAAAIRRILTGCPRRSIRRRSAGRRCRTSGIASSSAACRSCRSGFRCRASSPPGPAVRSTSSPALDLNGDGDATVSPGPDRARTVPSDPSTSIGRNAGRLPREQRSRRARHQAPQGGRAFDVDAHARRAECVQRDELHRRQPRVRHRRLSVAAAADLRAVHPGRAAAAAADRRALLVLKRGDWHR